MTDASSKLANFGNQGLSQVKRLAGRAIHKDHIDSESECSEDEQCTPHIGHAVFPDADIVKQAVRANLLRTPYDVHNYYKTEGCVQRLARSHVFDYITLIMIGFNALWIAVDTDNNPADLLVDAPTEFIVMENLFCVYFVFELGIRFMAFVDKRNALKDGWFVFDSVVVSMMVFETWIITIVALTMAGEAPNANFLRLVRLLRLSRMTRVVRLLRAFPEILILLNGMLAAAKSVFFTLCLLMILTYVFGVAFSALSKETAFGKSYFPDIPVAMYTLIVRGALLDEISALLDEIALESSWMVGLFLAFVLIASITVMNLLIGVLCEVVSVVAQVEREELLVTFVKAQLEKVVNSMDVDRNGMISMAEMKGILESKAAVQALTAVGVDPVGLIDMADFLFSGDGEHQEITFTEFMEELLLMRGKNTSTVKDIINLRKTMAQQHEVLVHAMQKLERDVSYMMTASGVPLPKTFRQKKIPSSSPIRKNPGKRKKSEELPLTAEESKAAKASPTGNIAHTPAETRVASSEGRARTCSDDSTPSLRHDAFMGKELSQLQHDISHKLSEMQSLLNRVFDLAPQREEPANFVPESANPWQRQKGKDGKDKARHTFSDLRAAAEEAPEEVSKQAGWMDSNALNTLPGEKELEALEGALREGFQKQDMNRPVAVDIHNQQFGFTSAYWTNMLEEEEC